MTASGVRPVQGSPATEGLESVGSKLKGSDPARTDQAAKDLESTFLGMLLKEMRQTLGPDGMFGQDGGDVHGGLFDLFLGQHLAQSGGVGIADYVRAQLPTSASV
jgi:flagellar protein FlgJ